MIKIFTHIFIKNFALERRLYLKNMQNYKCKTANLSIKKWFIQNQLKIYKDHQSTHPGGLNT